MLIDEGSRGSLARLAAINCLQKVCAKRRGDKYVNDTSLPPITPSIGQDATSIFSPPSPNGLKFPINAGLLLLETLSAHVVVE